jgi:tetratricopeptide (TPR) repeat protein
MEVIIKNSKGNPKSSSNPQYEQMMALSKQPLPEFQLALINYQKGEYDDAVSKLNEALEKLDPLELKNRAVIYSLLAECYIKLKDDDGYIQNKIRYVRVQRKINKILKETYPQSTINENVFLTTEEASTNLLRVKSSVAKLPDSPMVREMVKKAELDLEVARKVTQ